MDDGGRLELRSASELDDEELANRYRLPGIEAETLVPALLVYRAVLSETAATRVVVR